MPKKFIKYLNIINEKFFYSNHDIVVLETETLQKEGFNYSDLKEMNHFLKEKGLVEKINLFQALKISPVPVNYESKERVLNNHGFLGSILHEKSKEWLALKFSSKQDFLNFFNNNVEKEDQESLKINYDSMNGIVSYGGKTYSIQEEERKRLFQALWDNRKKMMQKGYMLVQAGLVESSKNISQEREKWLKQQASQLNRIFKNKKFPLTITLDGGIQLIEKE